MAEALASKQLSAGAKTYFFNIRSTSKGGKYLHIKELGKRDGEKTTNNIAIFADHVAGFAEAVQEAAVEIAK